MPSRDTPAGYGEFTAGALGPTDAQELSTNEQFAAGGELPAGAVETGTTVVGLTTDDAVVLGADRRASLGGRFVSNKGMLKIEQVHPTAAMALSGAVGHIQSFTRNLRAETDLYEARRDERMSIDALSTLAGNLLRSAPLHVSPVLGGLDEEGSAVFSLDAGGGVMADDYAATGSGMQLAYGVLEREYDPDATVGEATRSAARAIESANERDAASGNGLSVATITGEGVEIEEFDDPSALADGEVAA
ncbi:proteasome subunit beta [Halobacteriales archaeon QS_1_68_20]|nr:MAG: proteasome subunit beta [Halobacteriales archaeon QS_1_68_20]